jgi:signal transduction histidine kinase
MASEAETISAARIGRRLPQPAGNDEIAELGRTLNAMLDRIKAAVARERSFIDNAAHELRTPIAVLRGELELAELETDDPPVVAASLRSALEEADRLTRITEDLLTLARADAGELVPGTASTDLLASARSAVQGLPHRPEVTIEVRGEPTVVRGDPEWIGQMIRNLVVNGERYARSRVVVTTTSAGGHSRLVVADDGPGFPPELLLRAFDRFARGEGPRSEASGGAGIGLAIVASLVHALGGTVTASNGGPLGGACVEATLPVAPSADSSGR